MPDLYLTRTELRDRRIVGDVLLRKQHSRGKADRDDRTRGLKRNSARHLETVHSVKLEPIAKAAKE